LGREMASAHKTEESAKSGGRPSRENSWGRKHAPGGGLMDHSQRAPREWAFGGKGDKKFPGRVFRIVLRTQETCESYSSSCWWIEKRQVVEPRVGIAPIEKKQISQRLTEKGSLQDRKGNKKEGVWDDRVKSTSQKKSRKILRNRNACEKRGPPF